MADINSLSFGCGNTLLANQLNIMADAIRSLITLVGTIGDKVGSYIPLSGSEEITGVLAPDTDEGHNLGKSTKRWGTVWASTGGFKTIDFYDLQTSNKLGTLEINVNNGRLQYDNKTIALLSDIVNINPGENVITTDGDSVNLSDYTVSCNNIICDNTIRAKQKGSFQKIIIGDDPDYSELNEEEHPIYATLEYNIFSRDPDDSSFEDNNLTISTVLLLGRGLYEGAPIHIDTNYKGLYVDGNLIIPLPPIEEDEDYNTYLHVDENGSLEWVSASPGVGATSLSGLSDVSSYSSDQGKYLKVKNDGTGTEWSNISLSDLSNTKIGGSDNALSNELVLVYDSSLSKWKNTSLLANLPSVSGHANEYLKVNNDGTLAEWTSVAPGSPTVSITDGTSSDDNQKTLSANTKYKLTVGENSYVFTTPPGGSGLTGIKYQNYSSSSATTASSSSGYVTLKAETSNVSFDNTTTGVLKISVTGNNGISAATDNAIGGFKTGFSESNSGSDTNRNYAVKLSDDRAYVNVPWTDSGARTYTSVSGGPTANKNLSMGGNFTVPYVSLDANGQISILNKTMTLPSSAADNTLLNTLITKINSSYNSGMIIGTTLSNSLIDSITNIITQPTFKDTDKYYILKGTFNVTTQGGIKLFVNPLFRIDSTYNSLQLVVNSTDNPTYIYCASEFNTNSLSDSYRLDSINDPKDPPYKLSTYIINLLNEKYNITPLSSGSSSLTAYYLYSPGSSLPTIDSIKYYIEPNNTSSTPIEIR